MERRDSDDIEVRSNEIEDNPEEVRGDFLDAYGEEDDFGDYGDEQDDKDRLGQYQEMVEKCNAIIAAGKLYKDTDFEGDRCLIYPGEEDKYMKGFKTPPKTNRWKRIHHISNNPTLFGKGISPN
jgi:hypothetical protein